MTTNKIDGLSQFVRELERKKQRAAKDIGTPVLNAGLKILMEGVRGQIPPEYAQLAKLVGKRIDKSKSGNNEVIGKVGFGVGRKGRSMPKRKNHAGVGISSNNIHWLVLGTVQRQTKTGANRGEMPAILANCVPQGVAYSNAAAIEEMGRVFRELVAK